MNRSSSLWCAVAFTFAGSAALAQSPRDVRITIEKVADNVYVLFGQGGNIGVCVGEDGVFMIDDQFAPLTGKITEAVATLSEKPIRFVINTHWHGDHTGGNENLGKAGSIIVAHENVRVAMSEDRFIEAFNMNSPAAPKDALPVITFTESIDFHLNGEHIHVFHVDPAHTDGDSMIWFEKANVVHMGDTFFNGFYPFIDASSGGWIGGMIAAADVVINHANDETKIIPGHGPVATAADLKASRAMLATVQASIEALIDAGKTRDEVIAAKPTAVLDAEWGDGFLQPDVWVGIVYDGIVAHRARVKAAVEHGHDDAHDHDHSADHGHDHATDHTSQGGHGHGEGGQSGGE
jgi:cyclase